MGPQGLPPAAGPLAIVTRPEPQASQWVSKLRAQGVPARALPLLEISPAPDAAAVRAALAPLTAGDAVMFVSPNAASACLACLGGLTDAGALAGAWPWPPGLLAAATGPGTVAVLRQHGVPAEAIVAPAADAAQFDSEHLWQQLRQRPWAGRRALIVRGDGGRDWLADTWREAGAQLSFVQAYARSAPVWTAEQRAVRDQALAEPDSAVWLLSSSEAVDHLPGLAPGADWSGATAVASHPRIAERAWALGFGRVFDVKPTAEAVAALWRELASG